MIKIIRFIKKFLREIINKTFIYLAKVTKTNLTVLSYNQKGILKYGNDEITGEKFVIENVLKNKILSDKPILFDVGSNIGTYSLSLKKQFKNSTIYAFEPNPNTYKKIIDEAKNSDIIFNNIGLGSNPGISTIYDHKGEAGTEHSSIYKNVFTDIHHSENIEQMSFKNETLDNFCKINNINKIDFLKIDTEGSELDVLKGSKEMLTNNNIAIIQFEFNEMNVVSRVFLRDYYEILKNYNLFRIDSKRIIPLPSYNTENEIFKYQNFLAINKLLK